MTEPATATSAQQRTAGPGAPDGAHRPSPTGWLAFSALAWLLVALLFYRTAFTGAEGDYNLVLASLLLPLVVQASLVAGAAVGLWSTLALGRRRQWADRGAGRWAVGIAAGLLTGAVASGAVLLAYGMSARAVGVVAIAMGASGALGGALGAVRPARILAAGLTGALAVLVFLNVMALFSTPLLDAFGGGDTAADRYEANGLLAGSLAVIAGLIAGFLAYTRLRRAAKRAGDSPSWPVYLAAGAAAGIMLSVAELAVRLGVAQLLALASADITADAEILDFIAASRRNTGLVVLFVGAITAIIAYGRSLPKPTRD
ncbi:hypothetical protein CS0771_04170 [Catellatospora sp. IY07-71]|uniref:hypothetical protein n=1 Tax=Catellatospora sp. IY07-71 TaxID=2728827 RepID=UPI001BB32078|nr:hypothetical protein [Catellatospora sp. IY07-71]BCJ70873.1 hypothetical protein CS0771_04170 [Catellatospora sp. IY07-71]